MSLLYTLSRSFCSKYHNTKNLVKLVHYCKMESYDSVLKYWFEEIPRKSWFVGTPDVDQAIKDRFGEMVVKARNGELSSWEDLSAGLHGGLAFIILIDQFCRNIYRGTADSFSHDGKALAVALKIIDSGKYKEFTPSERFFLYLPLEHHEDEATLDRCVELYKELFDEYKGTPHEGIAENGVVYSRQHQDVIKEFGRYPKRNVALGRKNTPAEEIFLKETKTTF